MNLEQIKALDGSLPEDLPFRLLLLGPLYKALACFTATAPDGEKNPERLKFRTDVLHAIEAGNNTISELADYVATRNVERILDTMERLGIRYDLLARESDILHLHFWDRAFELMKSKGVIRLESEGKNKGCWVMPFESHTGTDEHEADKIIVRSNGTVTYTGKDIAYQFGSWAGSVWILTTNLFVLTRMGTSRGLRRPNRTPKSYPEVPRPNFGGGVKVYNVIDSRQAYPQEIVARGVVALVPEIGADASVHFGYEMVALSPAACTELGIELSEEDRASLTSK